MTHHHHHHHHHHQPPANKTRTVLPVIAAVAIVAVVVTIALLQKPPPLETRGITGGPSLSPVMAEAAAAVEGVRMRDPRRTGDEPDPGETVPPPPPPGGAVEIPAWEMQIDGVLRANLTEGQTAQALLHLLPTLPQEGQIEAASHITNLLPDQNFNQVRPTLMNPNTPEPVLSVFFADLMNRDDSIKLRAFLDIARMPTHPYHEEAASNLMIYLGEDHGNNWVRWRAAVEQYLRTQAQAQP